MRDYARLDVFLDRLQDDLYPDSFGQQNEYITNQVISSLVESGHIHSGMNVLDVGCGIGLAAKKFRDVGCHVVCMDPQSDYLDEVTDDQSFMQCSKELFDLVWARHVLEHSPMPYFTLTEYWRVLKPGGLCYVEVPAPDTQAEHESNANHYSVMGARMWAHLMKRAGFINDQFLKLDFVVKQINGSPDLPDTYFAFLLRKPT